MNNHLPWDIIPRPHADLKLLRVDAEHYHDFLWGRDSLGRPLLLLLLPGIHSGELKNRKIELTGIKAEIRRLAENGELYFQLTLLATEKADIFYILCKDLIEKTRTVPDLQAALHLIYQQLERWRTFLSKTAGNILTKQEVQGLFAELSFLEECLDAKTMTVQTAIEGWQGPLGAPHDFIYGAEAIEITSIGSSSAEIVRISGEKQLITHSASLYLRIIFLTQDIHRKNGLSLNGLVQQIREKLPESELPVFDSRLSSSGYINIQEYDWPCFSVSQTQTYGVTGDFPRLTPDTLPQGICDVSYMIRFSSIKNYLISNFKLRG